MSSSSTNKVCSSCFLALPLSSFVRGKTTNSYFKNCTTCRARKNARRQNLRRQRSAAQLSSVVEVTEQINDDRLIGNENLTNNIDPQILNLEFETNNRETEITDLNTITENLASNIDTVFCNGCKLYCASSLFKGRIQGKTYKTCSDCRLRIYGRRYPQAQANIVFNNPTLRKYDGHVLIPSTNESDLETDVNMRYCTKCKKNCPTNMFTNNPEGSSFLTCSDCRLLRRIQSYPPIFPVRSTDTNIVNPLGEMDDIYDASDNENMGAQTRQLHRQEVVGEEAMADDEPVIILSHTDSREYAAHMRAREALPEDHDDIFNNLPEDNFDHGDNNPVEIVTDVDDNSNGLNEDTMVIDNDNGGNEVSTETTAPRRLPQWLAPLPTHRTIPAAYTSRYNRNLPTHNLGRCTSVCPSCHALHWPQERVHSSSVARPRFQTCCKEGQ
ncbi:hypothetical protein EPUL_004829, partial [Erysiphe pulchra]